MDLSLDLKPAKDRTAVGFHDVGAGSDIVSRDSAYGLPHIDDAVMAKGGLLKLASVSLSVWHY